MVIGLRSPWSTPIARNPNQSRSRLVPLAQSSLSSACWVARSLPQDLALELADGVFMDVHTIEGQDLPLTVDALTSPHARTTFATLQWYPYYRLLAVKSFEQFGSHYDVLFVELNPELSQSKK